MDAQMHQTNVLTKLHWKLETLPPFSGNNPFFSANNPFFAGNHLFLEVIFPVLSEYYSHNTNHPFSLWHPYDKQGERRRQGLPSNESVAHCGKNPKNLSAGEIQTTILRNTNTNLEKYKQQPSGEIQTRIWRNANNKLEKYKQHSGEIQTRILRNKNNNLEKYKQKQTVNWNATQMYVNTM